MKALAIFLLLALSLFAGCDSRDNSTRELSPEKKLELAEKCSKAGKDYFREHVIRNNSPESIWGDPEYHYSSRLNTCLIHIRQIYPSSNDVPSLQYNQVIDVFSNKTLLYGWYKRDVQHGTEELMETLDSDIPNFTSNEYFKRKDKLFRE